MKAWLYPTDLNAKILKSILLAMLIGSLIAGLYGIAHDQMTYSISPEYFTEMKFHQFAWARSGEANRVFVAKIGFLATWWVGALCSWIAARQIFSKMPKSQAW